MAETRETQVIEDVINSTEISNPRTTEEAILAKIVAGEQVDINARTRLQYWLSQLESGGSSVTVEPITINENGIKTAPEGKAYSPVTVAVPNPNSIEVIAGTMANPWGEVDISDLVNELENNNANAQISWDATAIGFGTDYASLYKDANGLLLIARSARIGSSTDYAAVDVNWRISDRALNSAKALTSSTGFVDLSGYASLITTELTIIHHPIPEDNT